MTEHNQEKVERSKFEAFMYMREHPGFGWISEHWFRRGDDPAGYANEYVQGAWVMWQARAHQHASVSIPTNEVRKVVTDAMVSMVAGVTGLVPPSGPGAIPDFVQAPIDRAVTQITKLLSTAPHPVSGEQKQADGWISPTDHLPDVPAGDDLDVLVAVRRAHNGKVYVFTTSYLNRYPVLDHDQFIQDDDNDHREITGWFYLSDDEETWHRTLCKGDELVAWQLKPAAPGEVAAHRAQQGEQQP